MYIDKYKILNARLRLLEAEAKKYKNPSKKLLKAILKTHKEIFRLQRTEFTQPICSFKGNSNKSLLIRQHPHNRSFVLRATGTKPTRSDTLKPELCIWTGFKR